MSPSPEFFFFVCFSLERRLFNNLARAYFLFSSRVLNSKRDILFINSSFSSLTKHAVLYVLCGLGGIFISCIFVFFHWFWRLIFIDGMFDSSIHDVFISVFLVRSKKIHFRSRYLCGELTGIIDSFFWFYGFGSFVSTLQWLESKSLICLWRIDSPSMMATATVCFCFTVTVVSCTVTVLNSPFFVTRSLLKVSLPINVDVFLFK